MNFSLIYLAQRFFYRIYEFLRNWYVGGFLAAVHKTLNILEAFDRRLALRINLRYLFRPIYQDYSFLGRLLGFLFRGVRIIYASLIYFVIIVIAAGIYLAWAVAPIYILYKGFYGNGGLF
ncbi:MAG: hypothetical protein UY12_C0037G0009 [Parcubacteria group bacterium GW2011_GWA2_47_8b]|uniref:Uncharacterized protein n=2 Tax=Candidatus Harrisoniibacteriota TaxID=1817905 RepID=A0A1G1ZUJ7_9BACT|nr:MAG: hypothetical protein UY12_C0037G0009 [Parcubacteria group bacterium GW2011_GWA2_47_8b]KKU93778.1 MAG: hypothetical protein UY24_C0018G0004 [Parcubacteria group bacterium GW2011_GWA1_48_11b]KKU97382.1 MAG: hypothetical protein UY30_C0006G0005 [Parcubacteria group bacterium GW2011_GWB1_48_6]OGY65114.1 MAG: hypothetical protein A3E64_01510 [Candidatus Harrisonbacteria bacterium RIFCSPHIGHO2_12_FULL_48_16]OGY68398.1 MAG: hypothetical protein A2214_00485 [Candidatus Harrisonbacteria bacteriu